MAPQAPQNNFTIDAYSGMNQAGGNKYNFGLIAHDGYAHRGQASGSRSTLEIHHDNGFHQHQPWNLGVPDYGSSDVVRRSNELPGLAAWQSAWLRIWVSNVGRKANAADIALFRSLLEASEEAVRACLQGRLDYDDSHGAHSNAKTIHTWKAIHGSPFDPVQDLILPPDSSAKLFRAGDASANLGVAQHAYRGDRSLLTANMSPTHISSIHDEAHHSFIDPPEAAVLSKHESRGKRTCTQQPLPSFSSSILDPTWSPSTVDSSVTASSNPRLREFVTQFVSRRATKKCKAIRGHRSRNGMFPCTVGCGARFGAAADAIRHEEIKYPQQFFFCLSCGDPNNPLDDHLFTRVDKMRDHLKAPNHTPIGLDQCRVLNIRTLWPEKCGLCTHYKYRNWDERGDHYKWHCKRGDYGRNAHGGHNHQTPNLTSDNNNDDDNDDDGDSDGDDDEGPDVGEDKDQRDGADDTAHQGDGSGSDDPDPGHDHGADNSLSSFYDDDFFESWVQDFPQMWAHKYATTLYSSTLRRIDTSGGPDSRDELSLERDGVQQDSVDGKCRQWAVKAIPQIDERSNIYLEAPVATVDTNMMPIPMQDPGDRPSSSATFADNGPWTTFKSCDVSSLEEAEGSAIPCSPIVETHRASLDSCAVEIEGNEPHHRIHDESPRFTRRRAWQTAKVQESREKRRLLESTNSVTDFCSPIATSHNARPHYRTPSQWITLRKLKLCAVRLERTTPPHKPNDRHAPSRDRPTVPIEEATVSAIRKMCSDLSFVRTASRGRDHVKNDREISLADESPQEMINSSSCEYRCRPGGLEQIKVDPDSGGDAFDAASQSGATICTHCNTEFYGRYQRGNLARHVRQQHSITEAQISEGCVCRICKQGFKRQDARRKHEWKKHGLEDTQSPSRYCGPGCRKSDGRKNDSGAHDDISIARAPDLPNMFSGRFLPRGLQRSSLWMDITMPLSDVAESNCFLNSSTDMVVPRIGHRVARGRPRIVKFASASRPVAEDVLYYKTWLTAGHAVARKEHPSHEAESQNWSRIGPVTDMSTILSIVRICKAAADSMKQIRSLLTNVLRGAALDQSGHIVLNDRSASIRAEFDAVLKICAFLSTPTHSLDPDGMEHSILSSNAVPPPRCLNRVTPHGRISKIHGNVHRPSVLPRRTSNVLRRTRPGDDGMKVLRTLIYCMMQVDQEGGDDSTASLSSCLTEQLLTKGRCIGDCIIGDWMAAQVNKRLNH
ncbi:hypothetical protein DE146DRAFT_749796 [Phaeosphaeria sp. MPI-PUGE-AT-0046c]|nr:hypothetical protein DE146DRAFT_749796 [Phaeosphaeria sp. MPI-PUGE-AT-0046c]